MIRRDVLRFDTETAWLRAMAFLEGLSYLVLLFVAMPLKYGAGMPLAVRLAGTLHGLLFVVLGLLALHAVWQRGKSVGWVVRFGILALIPFGTFFLDPELRADDEAYRAGHGR